jgi:hypothetical protein
MLTLMQKPSFDEILDYLKAFRAGIDVSPETPPVQNIIGQTGAGRPGEERPPAGDQEGTQASWPAQPRPSPEPIDGLSGQDGRPFEVKIFIYNKL